MPVVSIHKTASSAAAKLEGARGAHSFLKVLYIEAERSGDENASDIKTSDDTMKLGETQAQTIRELHRPEQKRTRAGQTVRQQPPLERLIVLPYGVCRIDKKVLVMAEDIQDHQANERKEQIFHAQPR
jgi:hypothetical protein